MLAKRIIQSLFEFLPIYESINTLSIISMIEFVLLKNQDFLFLLDFISFVTFCGVVFYLLIFGRGLWESKDEDGLNFPLIKSFI